MVGGRRHERARRISVAFVALVAMIAALGVVGSVRPPAAGAAVASSVFSVPSLGYGPSDPVVAITFDDGPSGAITPQILDILRRYGAVATFFEIGGMAAQRPDLARAVVAQGSAVQGHSYDHVDLTRIPISGFARQVDEADALLEGITGQPVTTVRPPFGSFNATVVDQLNRRNLTTVMWSCNPGDTMGYTADRIAANAVACARPGAIIPLHDSASKAVTVAALPRILEGIRAKGLRTVTLTGGSPKGNLEAVTDARGAIRVGGWALDPDTSASIGVGAWVDGKFVTSAYAANDRPDIGAAFPGLGAAHGFDFTFGAVSGHHTVCVAGYNRAGGGSTRTIGCREVDLARVEPFGALEAATDATGAVRLSGWTFDPDLPTASLSVHAYVDGRYAGLAVADAARPDIAAFVPAAGEAHGFSFDVPAGGGNHSVCAYAINVGPGIVNPSLGCRSVYVRPREPYGNVEAVAYSAGVLRVAGWSVDPDSTSPIDVHVYVDGRYHGRGTADAARPDVDAAFVGVGPHHGFSLALAPPTPGAHSVCVYGINVGPGTFNPLLGCRTALVASTPIGALDLVAPNADGIRVAGWTLDPDTAGPTDVHIYVDGRVVAGTTAGLTRPDIAAAFAGYGAGHGFDLIVPAAPGVHTVCAYAINVGAGTVNPLVACRTVTR
jgi:peptidoglycan/xylan/chitin deacetylase (PgdA/CDA1 family)